MNSFLATRATVVCASDPLGADELAHACGADLAWVVQLVEVGIVAAPAEGAPDRWHFHSADLERALAARRLERDFEVGLDAAALILDMQRELRRLRGLLAAQGLERAS